MACRDEKASSSNSSGMWAVVELTCSNATFTNQIG